MKITSIIWLEDIVDKLLSKHNVQKDEVREVLTYSSHFRFVEKGFHQGENVYAAMGCTEAGRYLIIFFIYKKDHSALILSARDMSHTERKRYEKK